MASATAPARVPALLPGGLCAPGPVFRPHLSGFSEDRLWFSCHLAPLGARAFLALGSPGETSHSDPDVVEIKEALRSRSASDCDFRNDREERGQGWEGPVVRAPTPLGGRNALGPHRTPRLPGPAGWGCGSPGTPVENTLRWPGLSPHLPRVAFLWLCLRVSAFKLAQELRLENSAAGAGPER